MSPGSRRKPVASSPRLMSAARSSPAFIIGMFSIAVRLIVRIAATRLLYLKLSQNRFGKARGALRGCHYDVSRYCAHPELLDRLDIAPVGVVEYEHARDVPIEARDPERRDFHPESAEHFVGGTFYSLGSYYRTDCRDPRFYTAERLANPGQLQDRSDRDERIGRREDDRGGFSKSLKQSRRGTRVANSAQLDFFDDATCAAMDEVFLERNRRPAAQLHEGPHPLVAHRNDSRLDRKCARDLRSDLTERRALMHPLGAIQMGREIAIAETEPRLAVKARECAEHVERFAFEAPSLRAIHYAGERVSDGIDIRRDVEPVKGFVVAGVNDDGQPFRIYAPDESPDELSCTHSPR